MERADDTGSDRRAQRRQLALLAVLAATGPVGVTRDQLLLLFWPDTDPARARHALDQSLYIARRLAGANAVLTSPTGLMLDATVLPSDVNDFSRALERGDLQAAAAAYTGPFLDGVYLAEAPEFEQWVEGRRSDLAGAFRQTLIRLAAAATTRGDFPAAVVSLRRAAASDPLSGTIAHALMLALVNAGQVSAALDAGRVHGTMVREQLESEPDPPVRELMARLREGTAGASSGKGRLQDIPAAAVTIASPQPVVAEDRRTPGPISTRGGIGVRAGLAFGLATIAALGIWTGMSLWRPAPRPRVSFRDRIQLTATGQASLPTLSGDGKTLAFATRTCSAAGCTFGVDVQDVPGGISRTILNGTSGIDRVQESPDGRQVLVNASINAVSGTFLVSTHGGAPQLLTAGPANFFGDDSLLIGPRALLADSVFWVSVAGLNGVARDSVRISAPGGRYFTGMLEIPGTPWFVAGITRETSYLPPWELRVIDRQGRERSRTMVHGGQLRTSTDAIWLQPAAEFPNPNPSIVRIAVDSRSGRISNVMDTIYSGPLTGFDVTSDGSTLVVDEGAAETSLYVLSLERALRGVTAPDGPLLRESAPLSAWLFPDGKRLLVERDAKAGGDARNWLSTLAVSTGVESPLPIKGTPIDIDLVDSVTVALLERDSAPGRGSAISRFVLEDIRSHVRRGEWSVADPGVYGMAPLPGGGWAWLGSDLHIHAQLQGDTAPRIYSMPAWYNRVEVITASPDGRQIAILGWRAETTDSVRLTVLSLADGTATPWATMFGEDYQAGWLANGSFELSLNEPRDTWTIYRIRGPGHSERVGTIPGPVLKLTTSTDLTRAAVLTRDYRGAVWMFRVVRR